MQRLLGWHVTDEVSQRITKRRQQLLGRQRVTGRRRVEHVVAEQLLWRLPEVRGQQVGERNRRAASGTDGRCLGPSQTQPATAGHPTQRLGDRGDDAEVRAGAHHDDGAAGSKAPDRFAKITAASGGGPATNIASIWPDNPFDVAPTMDLVLSRMRLPDASASPRAISTPGSSSALSQP
jgi:hypothetical protein